MSLIKKLAGDTAVYGLSSVLGKVLNYLLVPLYTAVFAEGEYGIISELYAYTAFVMIILLYRMETAYFRFGAEKAGRGDAYNTALSSILLSTLLFSVAFFFLAGPFGEWIKLRPEHQPLLYFLVAIWAFDVLSEIPYARLRMEGRAWRFAGIKLTNIGLNIGLNLFFLLLCPAVMNSGDGSFLYGAISGWYDPDFGIGYVFVANLFASISAFLLLLPQFADFKPQIDRVLWNKMLVYSSPLIIAGLAGITNEMLDRVLLKHLLPYSLEENERQLGIYAACYKLAVFMALFTQAFRYAAEPFFFQNAKNTRAPDLYAAIGKYFVITGLLAFLVITLYLDVFQLLLRREGYREGLDVVPILLIANLFLGLYYNLSVWYKLTDKTLMATWLGLGGAAITIGLNIWWIPIFGYMGSAWATFICYGAMAAASYFIGRQYYRLPYDWRALGHYTIIALLIYFAYDQFLEQMIVDWTLASWLLRLLLLCGFVLFVWMREKSNIRELLAVKE
ncbi:MAG: polysaccharide biosynthesis protein [Saprospirales bacterium]|nr:MAG: polysaccharide biosynthesis protein [Saprospirales bacterium]